MVKEFPTLEQDFIFLIQTKNKDLEHLILKSIEEKNIRLKSVERSDDLKEQQQEGDIITFIIGNDVGDPIQSAQRLHAFNKNARIILLSETESRANTLKQTIKFSPFIGTEVFCLDKSKKDQFIKDLNKILKDSYKAAKYRAVIAESNSQVTTSVSSQKSAFNQSFINKLMDITPIGIAIISRDGTILGWNKEAASIFKKNEAQVLGSSLSRYFEQPEGKKLKQYLKKSFKKRTSGPIGTLKLERTSSSRYNQILNVTAASFTYSGGTEKALILAIKDETERERARQELIEVNLTLEERVEERTASLLSYQNQLRSLASQLSKAEENERQRLATELHDNLGQILALNKIKVSSLKTDHLPYETAASIENIKEGLDDALAYTRHLMSDLKPPPSLDQEDIRASIEWLAKKMENHQLHVMIEDDGKPKPVNNEIRTILVQCVRELLYNVIKHAGVDNARISLVRSGREAKISVEDKGNGFDLHNNQSSSQDSGYGLFNISERIDLLGGRMDIDTEPGRGTKITLCVPVTEKDQAEQSDKDNGIPVEPRPESNHTKIRVLLVDDHKMMRDGLRKIVNEQDDLIVVAEASNGKEAIEKALETSPDVVVMDVNMPVMDGIKATQKLLKKMPDIRVIALSFHDHENVIESMREAGATAYLTKNEAFETLCATIQSEANLAK